MILFLTALAGGVGGATRFAVDNWVSTRSKISIPVGTVVVNVTACFFLGLLTGLVSGASNSVALLSIFGVGLMGGYSTFSTASVEGARLIRQRRYLAALVHAGGMLVICLLASTLAILIGSGLLLALV